MMAEAASLFMIYFLTYCHISIVTVNLGIGNIFTRGSIFSPYYWSGIPVGQPLMNVKRAALSEDSLLHSQGN